MLDMIANMTPLCLPTDAGIDVAKNWLDLAVDGKVERIANTEAALWDLVEDLAARGVKRVGIEPTGGYERLAVRLLRQAGLDVCMIDTWRLRQFAKSRGTRTKTDRIDARMIAEFMARENPRPWPEPSAVQQRLTVWQREARRAATDLQRLQARRRGCEITEIATRLDAEIAVVKDTLKAAQQAIAALLEEDAGLAENAALLQSIPGVGTKTVQVVLAELPELGALTPGQAAALAGVAPYRRESGKRKGPGVCEGGRAALTRALFMTASAAIRHSLWAKRIYEHLRNNGKRHKVAIIALARRLLVLANALVRKRTPWDPEIAGVVR